MSTAPEALRLAEWLQTCAESIEHINAANELRRLAAVEAHSDDLEGTIQSLNDRLDQSVHGHNQIFDLCKVLEAERDKLRAESEAGWAEVARLASERDRLTMDYVPLRAEVEKLRADARRELECPPDPSSVELQLMKDDSIRIEWIESNVCNVTRTFGGNLRIDWNNGADRVFVGKHNYESWRDAIDAAMNKDQT